MSQTDSLVSTDLEQPTQLINLKTGESLTLQSPTEDLGRYLRDMRDLKRELQEVQNIVQRELVARFDRDAKWTQHLPGGLKLSAPSPKPEEAWDGAELRAALLAFVDEGVLSIDAVDCAVETFVSYRVKKAGVNSLRSLGGKIAETIENLCQRSERDRYVSVSRG